MIAKRNEGAGISADRWWRRISEISDHEQRPTMEAVICQPVPPEGDFRFFLFSLRRRLHIFDSGQSH